MISLDFGTKIGHITFWSEKISTAIFLLDGKFFEFSKKIIFWQKCRPSWARWGAIFNRGTPQNVVFFSFKLLWGYEGVPGNTLEVMLLKINKSCFCCRELLILSKCEKNRRHKWKLSVPVRGRQKFRQKFLRGGPRPICCQFVISLKSYS